MVCNIFFQHVVAQTNEHGKATKASLAIVVAGLITDWWLETNIPSKALCRIRDMVLQLDTQWTVLMKQRNKTTEQSVKNRSDFQDCIR